MIMWKISLDPFITPLDPPSSSMLPILFSPPDCLPSIHIALYLPTSGKDAEFTEQMAIIYTLLTSLKSRFPHYPVFIRGDANINPKNKVRCALLQTLCHDFNLTKTSIGHPTYHHFVGGGYSDSELDVLLSENRYEEQLIRVFCNLVDPTISSHHDIVLSQFVIPEIQHDKNKDISLTFAPRIDNHRVKIMWSEEGSSNYHSCLAPNLQRLQSTWSSNPSGSVLEIILMATNSILDLCARGTNSYIDLSSSPKPRSVRKPKSIIISERKIRHLNSKIRKLPLNSCDGPRLRTDLKQLRRSHRRLLRYVKMTDTIRRNNLLEGLGSCDSASAFRALRSMNLSKTSKVSSMKVGDLVFHGERVADGIYESIRSLKTEPESFPDEKGPDFNIEYKFILDICQKGKQIPNISLEKATLVLKSLKKTVNDIFSITPLHYLNAGTEGLTHFHMLMNAVIDNVNIAGHHALNSIYAVVLYKGHAKDKENSRSYRTISTCPLLSKALDLYVREISHEGWNSVQAETQYLGTGMSHELACLLLTETIQYSLFVKKLPVFAIFLDAKSAFDRVLRKILVRNLFLAGTDDQRLIYLDGRLGNRLTYVDYDKQIMGPITDIRGLEQGGVTSSDAYKLYNNEQASSSQASHLGVAFFDLCISCISLADDSVLLSNNIWGIKNLLHLTNLYCLKYDVQLVPDKMKLIVFDNEETAASSSSRQ